MGKIKKLTFNEAQTKPRFVESSGIHNTTEDNSILQLSIDLQNIKSELLSSVSSIHNEFKEINKSLKKDYSAISSRFDDLEQLLSVRTENRRGSATQDKRGSLVRRQNNGDKKAKKKRGRRGIRSALKENYTAKKIAKAADTKNAIIEAIRTNMHFKSCSENELSQIADAFDFERFSSGSVIAAQSVPLDKFYFVESGTVDIVMDGESIASISPKQTFGDFALLFGTSTTSTFRAKDDCVLWYILREDYRSITSYFRRQRLEAKISTLRKVKIGEKVLGDMLDESELDALALATGTQFYKTGEPIVTEGESGEIFYMIEEGDVDVLKKELGEKPIVTLKAGNFFGERALFSDDVRAASCIAASQVKCLTLVRNDFVRMLGNLQDLLENEYKSTDQKESESKPQKEVYEITLPDLDLGHNLGVGSFSTVKLSSLKSGFDKYPELVGKEFALKCSSKELLQEKQLINSVKNEKKILSELDNPFIMKFYCDFEDESHIYFLLEAVIGVELFNVLCDEIKFPEQWCRFYTASVVLAFSEIHAKKVAYRDLKPENLMIDSLGYLKIVDFGFAKVVRGGKTWTLCGTPDYFAPEVIKNEGHDWAVDYWGLGVLIYEMITGAPPFTGKSDSMTYQNILANKIKFPADINPELKHIICGLCTMDQSKRLGRTKRGVDAIKEQLWFSGFSWESLLQKQLKAPWIPKQKKESGYDASRKRSSCFEADTNLSNVKSSCSTEKQKSDEKKQGLQVPATAETHSTIDNRKRSSVLEKEEEQDDFGEMIEFSKPAPRTRNRRQSYMVGKNRYEQQMADFMKNQKKGRKKLEKINSFRTISSVSSISDSSVTSTDDFKLRSTESERVLEECLELLEDDLCYADPEETSFDQFFLLSVKNEVLTSTLDIYSFEEEFNAKHLDPFLCKAVDLLDHYTICDEAKRTLSCDEIAQSCFPSGVKIRLLPRSALEGAERLGYIGPNSEKYMLHNFTNEDGVSSYGVSVISWEETLVSDTSTLRQLRQRRAAISTIQRALRQYIEKRRDENAFQVFFRGNPSMRRLSDPVRLRSNLNIDEQRRASAFDSKSKQLISAFALSKASESYLTMIENDKLGEFCVVEKCFVFVGIRREEQSLQLCSLKQIVNLERKIISHFTEQNKNDSDKEPLRKLSLILRNSFKNSFKPAEAESQSKIQEKLATSRLKALKELQLKVNLSTEQMRVQYPKNEIEHIKREIPFFEYWPIYDELESFSLPLPLPQMTGEFGVAKLLLTIKSSGLLSLINLLLIERSVLIIATDSALVTSCAGALLELLNPFTWASAFMPLIPLDMLDFVSSPVPFIAGACAGDEAGLRSIEEDQRVRDAVLEGMSVVNLNSGQLKITFEEGINEVVSNTHGIIHQRLQCCEKRIHELSNLETSALKSFNTFFQKGASLHESLTIVSIKRDICNHLSGYFESLSSDPEDWRRYGKFDESLEFEFFPSMLVTPLQRNAQHKEMMVHTQLFIGFIENIKDSWSSTHLEKAIFIADWIYFQYQRRLERLDINGIYLNFNHSRLNQK